MSRANLQKRNRLLPALLVGGACGFAAQSALAIQLGELDVQSSLGQPLRASIAYALSANEQIHNYCIFLKPGVAATGLPVLTSARLSVAGGRINIAGSVPIHEPMMSIGLTVDCPYSANLTRSYTVLLDPVRTPQPVSAPAPQPVAVRAEPAAPRATPARRTPTVSESSPIPLAGSYRVKVGDTLSGISSRIENRPVGLWQAVDAIFDANPDAFIDGDLNRLKAGSLLQLPSFDGVTVATVQDDVTRSATASTAADAPAQSSPAAQTPVETYNGADLSRPEVEVAPAPALPAPSIDTAATAEPAAADQTSDLRPGDVQISDEQPFVSPIDSSTDLTATDAAESGSTAGIVAAADPGNASTESDTAGDRSSQLLYWLGGSGLALFLGFVAFRSRSRFGTPAAPVAAAVGADQADDASTARAKAVPNIDFDIGVQADTQRQVVLDADLSAGTGLNDAADVELAQDFGFSTTHDLDGAVDLEDSSGATITGERPTTDIIPTHRFVENSILDREILPNDDEYDLSMIVDATKQEFSDGDVTAKDLMAVAVAQESLGADGEVDEYTLSKEVDYKILEQDYEEELTATHALNSDIVKAAIELADELGEATDDTAKIAAADDSLAVTGKHENASFGDDDETEILTDLDDTGINEAIPGADELTTELPLRRASDQQSVPRADQTLESTFEGTVELPPRRAAEAASNTQLTEELPTAENESTIEMDVESGHFRTKKLVG